MHPSPRQTFLASCRRRAAALPQPIALTIALAITLTFSLMSGNASAAPVDLPNSLPNMVGGGIGSTTQYAGGKDRMIGVVPGLRYVTQGGHLFEWYGPYAQYNFGGVTGFQWGLPSRSGSGARMSTTRWSPRSTRSRPRRKRVASSVMSS